MLHLAFELVELAGVFEQIEHVLDSYVTNWTRFAEIPCGILSDFVENPVNDAPMSTQILLAEERHTTDLTAANVLHERGLNESDIAARIHTSFGPLKLYRHPY